MISLHRTVENPQISAQLFNMPPKSSKKRSHSPAPPTSAEDASSTTTQPKEPKRRKVTQDADDDEAVPKGVDAEKIIKFLLSDEALRLLSKMDQGAKGDFRFPRDRYAGDFSMSSSSDWQDS